MSVSRGYIDSQPDGLPGFLQDEVSRNWASAFGWMKDSLVELGIKGVECRFISVCPADVLQYHGSERGLDRYIGDTDDFYRNRLVFAPESWQTGDCPDGMIEQLIAAGLYPVAIYDNEQWHGMPPGHNRVTGAQYAPGEEYWRFWVVIDDRGTGHFTPAAPWGSGIWGAKKWGFATQPANWPILQSIIKKHKPADSVCAGVTVIISGSVWETTRHWGDGSTWGGQSVKVPMGYS